MSTLINNESYTVTADNVTSTIEGPAADIEIVPQKEISLEVSKHEYSIVGDAYYARYTDSPPTWLTDILEDTIFSITRAANGESASLRAGLSAALQDLDLVRNGFDQQVISFEQELGIVNGVVSQLNSTLIDPDTGEPKSTATINNMQLTIASELASMASDIEFIGSSFKDEFDNYWEANIETFKQTITGDITSELEYIDQTLNGAISSRFGTLTDDLDVLRGSLATLSQVVETGDSTAGMLLAAFDNGTNKGAIFDVNVGAGNTVGGMRLFNSVSQDFSSVELVFDVDSFKVGKWNGTSVGKNAPFEIVTRGNTTETKFTGQVSVAGQIFSHNFPNPSGNITGSPSGFRLSSTASGTGLDPHIYGGYIRGGTLQGSKLINDDNTFIIDMVENYIYIA